MYAMRIKYGGHQAERHGFWNQDCDRGAKIFTYTFDDSEWIERVEIYHDAIYVHSATFITNRRRLDMCGTLTTGVKSVESGRRLEYISGVTGCWFDELQFHWAL